MCSRCGCLTDEADHVAVRPAVVEGVLEAGLLLVLAEDDGYGYDLATELTRRNLVLSPVLPARVYEALRRLEDDGAVTSREELSPNGPDRRQYCLTPVGRERLDRWAESLRQTERSLHRLLHVYDAQRTERHR
jgi:PadR family transcriptional regulator PadR